MMTSINLLIVGSQEDPSISRLREDLMEHGFAVDSSLHPSRPAQGQASVDVVLVAGHGDGGDATKHNATADIPMVFFDTLPSDAGIAQEGKRLRCVLFDIIDVLWRRHCSRKPRILVVDDDPRMKVFTEFLQSRVFEVRWELSARRALEVASKFRPDLIILDWLMDRRGTELFPQFKEDPTVSDSAILVKTAYMSNEELGGVFQMHLPNGEPVEVPAYSELTPLSHVLARIAHMLIRRR